MNIKVSSAANGLGEIPFVAAVLARGLPLVVALGFVIGCSSSGSSGGATSSNSALVASTWGVVTSNQWLLRVASFADVCGILQQGTEVANANEIEIQLAGATGQATLSPGSYPISSAGMVQAKFKTWDSACAKAIELFASSGSVTLTSALGASGASSSGSYNLLFPDGTHKSEAFSAPYCNTSAQGGAGTCLGGT